MLDNGPGFGAMELERLDRVAIAVRDIERSVDSAGSERRPRLQGA
jgi:hypothetical protein